ncbi:hypothetical protein DL93DRAFT_2087922, partial [Clavulina sp. PMI_390]
MPREFPSSVSVAIFVIRLLLLLPALASAQSVTFKTVQECLNYEYKVVQDSLCQSSNDCDANLCQPQYNASYSQVASHCELLMSEPASVVVPLMAGTCKNDGESPSNTTAVVVGGAVGGVALLLVILGGLFYYHKKKQPLAMFDLCGIDGAISSSFQDNRRAATDPYGFPNAQPSRASSHPTLSSAKPKSRPLTTHEISPYEIPLSPQSRSDKTFSSSEFSGRYTYRESLPHIPSSPVTPRTPSTLPPTPSSAAPLMRYPPSPAHHVDALDYSPYVRPKEP